MPRSREAAVAAKSRWARSLHIWLLREYDLIDLCTVLSNVCMDSPLVRQRATFTLGQPDANGEVRCNGACLLALPLYLHYPLMNFGELHHLWRERIESHHGSASGSCALGDFLLFYDNAPRETVFTALVPELLEYIVNQPGGDQLLMEYNNALAFSGPFSGPVQRWLSSRQLQSHPLPAG